MYPRRERSQLAENQVISPQAKYLRVDVKNEIVLAFRHSPSPFTMRSIAAASCRCRHRDSFSTTWMLTGM